MNNTVTFYKTNSAHILIIDDNALVLRNMKVLLDDKYSVSVAASATQAYMAMEKRKPNLILLDYEMPEMNGKDLYIKLKQDEAYKDIPIVFLTSAADADIVQRLLSLRPAGYILKPVNAINLMSVIEDVLRG
ncbi:MAG: response regulator [Lachnospiraceae bacterium]|nr:response regulator [Lachnospiraceae bacterium]MBQ7832451.1 response regulator [Lachnospiraceae bacterium]